MDGDAPLSPGNPHLLAAVRTFEIAMVPILHSIAPGDPKIPNRANRLKKFSVFGSASGQIPGPVSYTHLLGRAAQALTDGFPRRTARRSAR